MPEPSPFVRPDLRDADAYVPGLTVEEIKLRHGLSRVIKLASNENPLGTSPLVQKALERGAPWAFRYPANGNPRLVAALAEHLGADAGRIVCGNGSDEIIDLLLRTCAVPGRSNVLCYEGEFSMYRLTARLCGVEYRRVPRAKGHAIPLDALVAAADQDTAVVFVTSPDNPTGLACTARELADAARRLPPATLLAVDEAYVDFARPREEHDLMPLLDELPNVVLLRTFSKAYALAGLRLGYGILPPAVAAAVNAVRPPFTVNVAAEAAALAALEDDAFLAATLGTCHESMDRMAEALPGLGCEVLPTQANFCMFQPPRDAGEVFEDLLARGVIVRWLRSFGLPEHIRVNAGTREETDIFLETLEEVLDV